MLFNKFQLISELQKRGYSATCHVKDMEEKVYFAKWIYGLEKGSTPSKMLMDKLKALKKIEHNCIPSIIDYGFDEEEKHYCIINEYIDAATLENEVNEIHVFDFLRGLMKLIDCLKELLNQHKLSHGDIQPANILVAKDNSSYLIDFSLADLTHTLSQTKELEIFARRFAAPEKFNKNQAKGFPHQSDIYSIGKVLEWFFEQQEKGISEKFAEVINQCCHENPAQRPSFDALNKMLKNLLAETEVGNLVQVGTNYKTKIELYTVLAELNATEGFIPRFDVSPSAGNNIQLNIVTNAYVFIGALWLIQDKKLLIRDAYHKVEQVGNWESTYKRGQEMPMPLYFSQSDVCSLNSTYNLTPHWLEIQKNKQKEKEMRQRKEGFRKELGFFKELINKELDVLNQASLRVQYVRVEKKNEHEFHFYVEENKKYADDSQIDSHIDKASSPKHEGFEYILTAKPDKKIKGLSFEGTAFCFDRETRILKFKDCAGINFDNLPQSGYLFEDITQQEEEKNRQMEAIRKVEYNETQNNRLMDALFQPSTLKPVMFQIGKLSRVYQKDKEGSPLEYSYNQDKAIRNAQQTELLSIIQGPPGTGKTTVITEIVFQILAKKPNAKILITSQTNDAVDNVLEKLLENDIPILRLCGKKEPSSVVLKKHTMPKKIEGWKKQVMDNVEKERLKHRAFFWNTLKSEMVLKPIVEVLLNTSEWNTKANNISKMLERIPKYSSLLKCLENEIVFKETLVNSVSLEGLQRFFEVENMYRNWLCAVSSLTEDSTINQKLVNSISVIGATCNHIASKKYKNYQFGFDYVIMDEAAKATVAESLVPLVMAEKAILVGDHRQLRPMLTANKEVEKWLREKYKNEGELYEYNNFEDYFNRQSLFEKIITTIDESYKSQLTECRRCSEEQVKFMSKHFYEPFGDEEIEAVKRSAEKEHNLPLKVTSSIFFFDIGHDKKSVKDGAGSSYNEHSANIVIDLLKTLDKYPSIKKQSIGIISGYKAQVRKMQSSVNQNLRYKKALTNISFDKLTLSVIDKFQGLEKDIIVFDLTRTCHDKTLGFLANANRINVALSRQRKLLFIVGDKTGIMNASSKTGERSALQNYIANLQPYQIITNLDDLI